MDVMMKRDLRGGRNLRRMRAVWSAVAILGAIVTSAAGQTPPAPPSGPPASPPASAQPAAPAAAGTPATVVDDDQIESVLGQKVQSPTGEDLGRIVDVLVDRTGEIRAAVIDFGGFFGVGSRKIAVDWRALHVAAQGKAKAFVVDLLPDRLRVSPIYKEGEPVVILGRGQGMPKPADPSPAPGPGAPTPPAAAPSAPPAPN